MKIKFLPENVEHDIQPDQSVMKLAHEKGIKIKSVCNGMPSCAECRIKVVDGEHNVLPPSAKELSLIGTGHYIDQRRLSCQMICFGDVTVDLTEQLNKVMTDQQRRPQGSLRKDDSEVSHAVSGNLIDQEEELLEKIDTQSNSKPQKRTFKSDKKDNSERSEKRSKNRNRNRRNRHRKSKNKNNNPS